LQLMPQSSRPAAARYCLALPRYCVSKIDLRPQSERQLDRI
jgi:hypothetical protein